MMGRWGHRVMAGLAAAALTTQFALPAWAGCGCRPLGDSPETAALASGLMMGAAVMIIVPLGFVVATVAALRHHLRSTRDQAS